MGFDMYKERDRRVITDRLAEARSSGFGTSKS